MRKLIKVIFKHSNLLNSNKVTISSKLALDEVSVGCEKIDTYDWLPIQTQMPVLDSWFNQVSKCTFCQTLVHNSLGCRVHGQ